ncbi:MAG: hypothetical protein Q4A64_02885 [Porphyromonadaceae bacterium]|nr:hypothetical protein [Porphyromonadaceae bacterium]
MNSKKIFTLLLALGLLWSCDKKKDEPQQSSEGFSLEAEADADALGLKGLRGAFQFDVKDRVKLKMVPKVESFKTHAFFRHRLKPDVLGYAEINWTISDYDATTNKVKLKFRTKNLKVEKIGPSYNPANQEYLTIVANEDENNPYWFVAGVMGAPDSWVNKKTGRVHFKAMPTASEGSKADGDKEISQEIHAPLLSTFTQIQPDFRSNPKNLKKGRIHKWRFLARGMMIRIRLDNDTDINLNNAPIRLSSTDNSLVGDAQIGFSSTDVPRVDLLSEKSSPKFIFDTSKPPTLKITQPKGKQDVTHMLWAISKNSNNQTPPGVRAFITPSPSIGEKPLGRQGVAYGTPEYNLETKIVMKNNTSWLMEVEIFIPKP